METFSGTGRILTVDGQAMAQVRYTFYIDRHNRVWHGTAIRMDASVRLPVPGGPAILETEDGAQAPIHFHHRQDEEGTVVVFTGRGAPPGE